MEQSPHFDKQQSEEGLTQRELEIKERRRRQNRIAQRNHRKRKYQLGGNQNENSCQRRTEETGVDLQACVTSKIAQQSLECWLNALGLVSLEQLVPPSPSTLVNTPSPHEEHTSYPSPSQSLSPSDSSISLEQPFITKDTCIMDAGPAAVPVEGDLSRVSRISADPQFLEANLALTPSSEPHKPYGKYLQEMAPGFDLGVSRRPSGGTAGVSSPSGKIESHAENIDDKIDRLRDILGRPNVEERSSEIEGKTALHLSAERGHAGTVWCLIQCGSDTSKRDIYGATALHYAARMGYVYVMRTLLENGADGSAKDLQGRTPLHMAAESGHEEAVRLLVRVGIDVDIQVQAI
ncbi:uncharacterized protein GIQ15_06389 [Arthroderma uncinatum]|uniref:uncharacterized protein n=1 Tax=Arthroderma uncinatum TaxID=74035 RepID=UPI00144A7A96|nr:uncharacterized protein GIQ15_06389 [Arthroderma uncinatum]KAF3479413.1 hypothetical protein GIQ15_06389 [Arthroderma uncinatum]